MAWIKNGTPDTLGSAGDLMTISDMSASKFNMFMIHEIGSGTIETTAILNNDTGTNYAYRYSIDGAADGTGVSQTKYSGNAGASPDRFYIIYTSSISGEEKLGINVLNESNTAGAGTAPRRMELVSKYVPSPDADITRIDDTNTGGGDFAISSNLSALGSDGTESLNVQDGAIYYDTTLNKEYVLYNNTWTEV